MEAIAIMIVVHWLTIVVRGLYVSVTIANEAVLLLSVLGLVHVARIKRAESEWATVPKAVSRAVKIVVFFSLVVVQGVWVGWVALSGVAIAVGICGAVSVVLGVEVVILFVSTLVVLVTPVVWVGTVGVRMTVVAVSVADQVVVIL